MKNIFLLLALLISTVVISQETCETPEESLEELNSITKCSIKPSGKAKDKKSRQISVKVSASTKRYLKKRVVEKKSTVSSVGGLKSSGVSNTDHSSNISNDLSLKKEQNTSDFINSLSNSLSAEEVRAASKFNAVDEIPLFVACEKAKKKDQLSCFNTEMIKHINKHFRYPNEAVVNKIQGNVWVRFIIDKNGHVTNIKALGPKGGKVLDQEAMRVVSKLPKFIPGAKEGNKTSVKYGFPISFSLEE